VSVARQPWLLLSHAHCSVNAPSLHQEYSENYHHRICQPCPIGDGSRYSDGRCLQQASSTNLPARQLLDGDGTITNPIADVQVRNAGTVSPLNWTVAAIPRPAVAQSLRSKVIARAFLYSLGHHPQTARKGQNSWNFVGQHC